MKGSSSIKIFLTDCDGCLTDGGMYYSENGDELKKFNTKDGMAFKRLKEKKILTGIITGEKVNLNKRRADKLKLDIFIDGCENKLEAAKKICKEHGVTLDHVLYIGDDINDLELIKAVGIGCAPADAVEDVKKAAKYVTKARGGEGVIREVTDMLDNNGNVGIFERIYNKVKQMIEFDTVPAITLFMSILPMILDIWKTIVEIKAAIKLADYFGLRKELFLGKSLFVSKAIVILGAIFIFLLVLFIYKEYAVKNSLISGILMQSALFFLISLMMLSYIFPILLPDVSIYVVATCIVIALIASFIFAVSVNVGCEKKIPRIVRTLGILIYIGIFSVGIVAIAIQDETKKKDYEVTELVQVENGYECKVVVSEYEGKYVLMNGTYNQDNGTLEIDKGKYVLSDMENELIYYFTFKNVNIN